jgi:hypothetical protein
MTTDTDTSCSLRDRCKCSDGCRGFKVELYDLADTELESIAELVYFKIKVTALPNPAWGNVDTYGGSTLTLFNGTGFPSSGSHSGFLLDGNGGLGTKISWTGRSGNQLTGVTGHGTPATGTMLQYLPDDDAIDTSYSGTVSIEARANGEVLQLLISGGMVVNGALTSTNKVMDSPLSADAVMTVTVRDMSCPGKGLCGSDSATLLYSQYLPSVTKTCSLDPEGTAVGELVPTSGTDWFRGADLWYLDLATGTPIFSVDYNEPDTYGPIPCPLGPEPPYDCTNATWVVTWE